MMVPSTRLDKRFAGATEVRPTRPPASTGGPLPEELPVDVSYAACRAITAQHSKSFSLAARLLPAEKRPAIWALYGFCRTIDDLVDHDAPGAAAALEAWRSATVDRRPLPDDDVSAAWVDTLERYGIPTRYPLELIDGVERDRWQTRYADEAELDTYCYGVASTVGLMTMHIVGVEGGQEERAAGYAIRLGIALQLTNVLRDVREDWDRGRVYLPQDRLARFGVTETAIERHEVTDAFRALMADQIDRARRLYDEAWPGIALLDPGGRTAIAAAATFYRGILDQIEHLDYDVFRHRASVSRLGKLRLVPGVWYRTRRMAQP